MPNLNEIAKFREELKNIANEDKITASWGERVYDELPPPDPAEVPDIDLDALLPATESGTPADNAAPPAAAPSDSFTTVPVTDTSDVPADIPAPVNDAITEDQSEAYPVDDDGAPEASDLNDFLSSFNFDDLPGGDISDGDFSDISGMESPDMEEADTDSVDPSAFTTDADNAESSFESLVPDLNDFDDSDLTPPVFDEKAIPSDSTDSFENPSSPDDDSPLNFDDMLSSFDFDPDADNIPHNDTQGDEYTPSDLDDSDESGNATDSGDSPAGVEDTPSTDDLNGEQPSDTPFSLDDFNIPDFDLSAFDSLSDGEPDSSQISDEAPDSDSFDSFDDSAPLDGTEYVDEDAFATDTPTARDDSPAPQQPSESADSPDSKPTDSLGDFGDLGSLDELSLYSENRDEEDDKTSEPPAEAAQEAYDPADTSNIDLSSFDFNTDGGSAFADIGTAPSSDAGLDDAGSVPSSDADSAIPENTAAEFFTQQSESDSGDQSGFSLEDNPLDNDITEVADDQFNLPDNFKDFSSDTHNKMFDSVIAKSTGGAQIGDALSISDDDYFKFLHRLESFPLNVQLAIQDYIANGDDRPENKMDFIRYVIAKDSLKRIANKLEKITNKSIPIPRGFQRKSVEEYEREKKTFKYWMLHRFLPVAVMSAIALILAFCISVLSWQFIYKPATSESLYKKGYAYLQNGQYETAVEKFNKAGEYKKKKRWYFSYARAFRAKKQFTAAEKMYARLIYDFNYDKQGGLEYADMLSTDLRNYEKAETVLRRRVLDQHVNDKDGLLALGDVYMNWADEDPEKYETAVKIYTRLIELYGETDTYLLRMMRYFIRTDKLSEVLNLKERFSSRLSKIGAADLTELSGYLLEKRYNPKPLDSETLRMQIDDVRMLLEKAVQADKTSPEAYYNLGRFFIYNNKQDGAIENLTEAIKRFKTAAPMTTRRTISHVDAMRLLGEQLVTQKKYLEAQTLYADALNIYRDYTAFKPLAPNKNIGKLYADYGDIAYFISYNADSALDSYQHAIKELYNTPSVHYRIGYLHYQQENYQQAIEAMSLAYAEKANDKNLLYGFGNAFFKRGDYFAALAAYEQLLALLNTQRARKNHALINTHPDDAAFIEQYMYTVNNLGATLNRLAEHTSNSQKNGRALALYAEATRAWDALTRNPQTMIRAKSVGLAYLNIQNMLNSKSIYDAEIYTDIPMLLENEKALEQQEDK